MDENLTESLVLVDTSPAPSEESNDKKLISSNPSPEAPAEKPSTCACHASKSIISSIDKTVLRLNNFISKSQGEERAFAVIGYSASIIHHALHSNPARQFLRQVLPAALQLKPDTPPKPYLLALASLVSEIRTTLRLFGLLPLWAWGSATYKSPPTDPVLRTVAYTQVTACVLYQILENVAFLTSKGVLSKRVVEKLGALSKWSLWSIRAWLVHILLEFVRISREKQLARRKESGTEKSEESVKAQHSQRVRQWRKSLVNNVSWLPLCLHWSFEQGIGFPSSLVGIFSLSAGGWGIYDLWNATPGPV
ncbi:hypothetical protein FQN57_003731 [Myotisia sp. PD_48]|nr:hypothetical protein FQN57_003731 [Myotisia sp. PD_48]